LKIEEKIYCKLLQIPAGYVTTYGDLAKAINLKNGQRIVGQIMKKNPFPVIIPCHRVVKSDGAIGGYAYGTERKKYMLYKEGLKINNNKISNFKKNLFRF
jgi:methylated-DNA-[protein]-cysteine S-methyltransferase